MKKRNYILLAFIASCSVACDNFLEKIPENSVTDQIFFKTDNDFKLFADGLYDSFTPALNTVYFDFCTDFVSQKSAKIGNRSFGDLRIGTLTPNTSTASYYWDYAPIRNAYILLENIESANVSEETRKVCMGTAQYSLAYRYFMMLRAYENVPIVREVLTVENSDIASSPKEDVFKEALTQINQSIENLPSITCTNRERGRLSKLVALTLKADLLLYTASRYKEALPEATYQAAADAAKAAIDEANAMGYGLADDYQKLFIAAYQASADAQKEIIFERVKLKDIATHLDYMRGFGPRETKSNDCWADFTSSQALIDKYECTDGLPIWKSPLYDPLHPFKNRDPRLELTTLYPGNICSYIDGDPWISNTLDPSESNYDYMLSTYNVLDQPPSGYINIKYWERLRPGEQGYASYIVYRYGELLLMYAEALNEAQGPCSEVYNALSKLRARPSVNMPAITPTTHSSQAELRELIRNERAVELFGEGKRYWDIRRWGIGEEVMNRKFYSMHIAKYKSDGSVEKYMDKIYVRTDLNDPSKEELFEIPDGEKGGLFLSEGIFNDSKYYVWPVPQSALDKSFSGALRQHELWK